MTVMTEPRKRVYASRLRLENAQATRARITAAAHDLMVSRGYADTTMAEVARLAGVAVQTLYTSCPGGKPGLAKMVYDVALAGDSEPIAQRDRPAVRMINEEPEHGRKLGLYAAMVAGILERISPVHRVLRAAAGASPSDTGLQTVLADIERERLAGARAPAEHLRAIDALKPGLTADRAAHQLYALTSIEVFERLTQVCGWTAEAYRDWLTEILTTALLPRQDRPKTE